MTNPVKAPSTSLPRFGSPIEVGQCSEPKPPDVLVVSSCDYQKVSSIFSSFDSQKASIVSNIGFGGLLKLPRHVTLNEHLSLWLYKNFNFRRNTLCLPGGDELELRPVDAHLILGIPFEGLYVQCDMTWSEDTVTAFKNRLCIDSDSASLTVSFLESILNSEYESSWSDAQKDAFKIAVVLYSVVYLLVPERRHEFPRHYL